MKIVSISWNSYIPLLLKAGEALGLELKAYSSRTLEDRPDKLEEALEACASADLVLLYYSGGSFWDELSLRLEALKKEKGGKAAVVFTGHDPYFWTLSSVEPEIAATSYLYFAYNGEENLKNLLSYLSYRVCGKGPAPPPPKELAWDGLFHPDTEKWFSDLEAYLDWYGPSSGKSVGILISRTAWVNRDLQVEKALVRELESRGLNVIPAFAYSLEDRELGTRAMARVIEDYFTRDGKPVIDCLIKLTPFPIEGPQEAEKKGPGFLKTLDLPLLQPIVSSYMTVEEWESSDGLGNDIAWYVAMPEFEGAVEPLIIGGGRQLEHYVEHVPIAERCARLAERVAKLLKLREKPVSEKKIAFILHNKPCASVEGTVGCASGLDSLESLARILQRLKAEGYSLGPVAGAGKEEALPLPADGKELIGQILERKAFSEFRWTSVGEIVRRGGALAFVGKEEYDRFFRTLSPALQERMIEAWGRPPGEAVGEMPPAMLHEGRLVISGLRFGNIVVCVQPKRGCAGPACNGKVCKLLHDPEVPPTHHYLATYRYLEEGFGADAVVHVGTHGNLEFLPGKGVGLSGNCFPDLAIGTLPHFYIYNSDNPPEGSAAKRRGLACLVDHMQTVMQGGGLYGPLEELDRLLGEYEQAKHDSARVHALKHLVRDKLGEAKLGQEIALDPERPFEELVREAHEALSEIRNTQIQGGLHVFGTRPEGRKRAWFINSVLRYEAGEDEGKGEGEGEGEEESDGAGKESEGKKELSLRRALAKCFGLDFSRLLREPGEVSASGASNGRLLEELDLLSAALIEAFLEERDRGLPELLKEGRLYEGQALGPSALSLSPEAEEALGRIKARLLDLDARLEASKEIEALLHGFEGGYIEPGPSGLIMRGRADVLPSGRNFYSLDPKKVPTKAAWRVGKQLAELLLEKYAEEEGRLPENIAFFWMASDIMWADGECMAQLLHLLGAEPVWEGNGKVESFRLLSLQELGRPRIDITVRASGILRDNFPGCLELIDRAVEAVAALEEAPEMNYVRKHTLGMLEEGCGFRDASCRIFSSRPGTYSAGVQLAVYASAWKDEKDLAEIFLYWNGYAYGRELKGKEAHARLARNLETVDLTYNKVVSDEYDLLGCCCYFGAQGGMTAAAREVSGREVRAYFGDSREGNRPEVRALADELRRVARSKLLNPKWIEGMKAHGYQGAGEISGRVGRVYGWEASTQAVDDWIFDEIANTFVLDAEMRAFFEENNPYALEEMARRLLEAEARKLWKPDPELLEKLRDAYLELEGLMEGEAGDGEFQGGSVEIMGPEEVPDWKEKMEEIRAKLGEARQGNLKKAEKT